MPNGVHVSSLADSPLLDSSGERLGKVEDVVARLDPDQAIAEVIGLKARIGGRELFVPADRIQQLGPYSAQTATTKLNLAQFERRPGEVLLRAESSITACINVNTARLVSGGRGRARPRRRHLAGCRHRSEPPTAAVAVLPRRVRGHDSEHREFVEWGDLEPFVGHVPTSRFQLARRRIRRLHPAQIADLVEAASHDEGEEILEAVGQDKELEADVFEELDDEHQVEFLRARSDADVAAVLGGWRATMPPTCCSSSTRIAGCRS